MELEEYLASKVMEEAAESEKSRLVLERDVANARTAAIAFVTAAAQAATAEPVVAAATEAAAQATGIAADTFSSDMTIDEPDDYFQDLDEIMFDVVDPDIASSNPGAENLLPVSDELGPVAAVPMQAAGQPQAPATCMRNNASANRAGRRMFAATTESWPDEPMSPRSRNVFLYLLADHNHIAAGVGAFISKPVAMAVKTIDKFRQVISDNPVHPGGQNKDVSNAINTALRFVGDGSQPKVPQAAFLGVTVPRLSKALAHSLKRKQDQVEQSVTIEPLSASYHNSSASLQGRWTRYKYAASFWISVGHISPSKRDFTWQSTPQEPVGWVLSVACLCLSEVCAETWLELS